MRSSLRYEHTGWEHYVNARTAILQKQIQWALNRDMPLVGSQGDRGQRTYTRTIDENLFEPLAPEVLDQFIRGDGGEISANPRPGIPHKMNALHSSSALAVNVFHYWYRLRDAAGIAAACGLCRAGSRIPGVIQFEKKLVINKRFQKHPNVDVVIQDRLDSPTVLFAIESKFTEAYGGRKHPGIKQAYLDRPALWTGIPALRSIAEEIVDTDTEFQHLHPAQLIKHILGVRQTLKPGGRFRLLYLWYDAFGADGARHRSEIERFSAAAASDGVRFHALTYQELILRLAARYRQQHSAYVQYLTSRYS